MMGLSERASYIVLGLVIGFVVGYIVRTLQDIANKENQVLDLLHDQNEPTARDERGFIRIPTWLEVKEAFNFRSWQERITIRGVALFLAVAFTAYAAFLSQMNTNDLRDQTEVNTANTKANTANSKNITAVATCTADYLSDTLSAVNERTTYSGEQSKANIALQKAQGEFVQNALQEPALEQSRVAQALRTYLAALNDFVEVSMKSLGKTTTNPYPTDEEFQTCLAGEMSPK